MGDKNKKPDTEIDAGEDAGDESVDLKKSLDDNLRKMGDLLKAKKDDDLREMMKDGKTRKKVKELMDEYEGEDDEEEGSEEDDEKMRQNNELMEDDEDEDKDGKKKRFGKKESCGKMKKSLDDVVEEGEEIIDAVPILKSFVGVLQNASEEISSLRGELTTLRKSFRESIDLQKSMVDSITSEADLVKSLSDQIEEFGSEPQPVKGMKGGAEDLLQKSFKSSSGEMRTVPTGVLRTALLKSFQEGTISSKTISKWELAHYNPAVLSAAEIAAAEKHIPKGGE